MYLMRLILFIISVVLTCLFFLQCADRNERNPFDPNNPQQIVNLTITPSSDAVTLNWGLSAPISGFKGFRIYRAIDDPEDFQPFTEVSPNQFSFTDSTTEQGRWYYYQISALGNTLETRPSDARRTYLGPGSYWVLSRSDFNIQQISYDFNHQLLGMQSSYLSNEWDISAGDSVIWLSYPQYARGIGKFNRRNGREELFSLSDLNEITDIEYVVPENRLYLLDAENASIYVIRDNQLLNTIAIDTMENFSRLRYSNADNRLYLLGQSSLIRFSPDAPQQPEVILQNVDGYQGQAIDLVDGKFYVLSASARDNRTQIRTISAQGGLEDSLNIVGFFHKIRYDEVHNLFYAAEALGSFQDGIVQLSADGNRQFDVPGFTQVAQIELNPFDRTIIVVDYLNNLISLFDREGNLISDSRNAVGEKYLYRPTRVYVE